MPELDPVIVLSARYGLALLFLSAAVGKFRGLTYFRGNLREYAEKTLEKGELPVTLPGRTFLEFFLSGEGLRKLIASEFQ